MVFRRLAELRVPEAERGVLRRGHEQLAAVAGPCAAGHGGRRRGAAAGGERGGEQLHERRGVAESSGALHADAQQEAMS